MNVEFKKSFLKDLERVTDKALRERVKQVIKRIEKAQTLHEVENIRKPRSSGQYYRIRIGDYRLGLALQGQTVTFVRFLHRKDVYRYFP